jgi:hypothetical protein
LPFHWARIAFTFDHPPVEMAHVVHSLIAVVGFRLVRCRKMMLSRMNAHRIQRCAPCRLIWMVVAAGLTVFSGTVGATEERYPVLQIGTRMYTNVTVTTKAKKYVFIVHKGGMSSIKPSELPLEVQEDLGYATAGGSKGTTNTAAAWAKREIAKVSVPQVKEIGKQLEQKWRGKSVTKFSAMGLGGSTLILAFLGIVLILYLFHSYCCMLICRKTGRPPDILVWVPVVQLLPLLRAAGMSGWWFLAYLVPVLNIVAQVLWCFNIVKARGKSVWVGVLLLLPFTSLFAFLYLAFSNGVTADEEEGPEPKVVTLQAA